MLSEELPQVVSLLVSHLQMPDCAFKQPPICQHVLTLHWCQPSSTQRSPAWLSYQMMSAYDAIHDSSCT